MTACLVLTFLPAPLSYLAEKYISKPIESWGLEATGVIAPSAKYRRVTITPGEIELLSRDRVATTPGGERSAKR